MKHLTAVLFLAFLLLSCNQDSANEKAAHLSGYWEIQRAELPEGITKEFRFSQLVDYIQVQEGKGFRKKVRPQLGGGFISSEDRESFELQVENDSLFLYYSTPYDSWKETVIEASEEKLKILNRRGILYTYKRFTPYSSDYGQEN